MASRTPSNASACVFITSRHSVELSILPCQRYTDSTCGTMFTQAASPRSTSVWAILWASSSDPVVVRTMRALVMGAEYHGVKGRLSSAPMKVGGFLLLDVELGWGATH